MQNLPAEVIQIAPEALEVANCYLQLQDIRAVADSLEIGSDTVQSILARREVKAYIDHVFFDTGYNNRYKIREAMDTLIQKKLQELEEADVGSSKDIADLLALSHKMSMEYLDKSIALEKLRQSDTSIRNQVNVQINDSGLGLQDGSKYGELISKLLNDSNKP